LAEVPAVPEEEARAKCSNAKVKEPAQANFPVHSESDQNAAPSDATRVAPPLLELRHVQSGQSVAVSDGDILGRHNVGKEIFDAIPEISRKHRQCRRQNGTWNVEDLSSTNGTTLDGVLMEKARPYPLAVGNVVCLAELCELRVVRI
jgi:hypothetical protein